VEEWFRVVQSPDAMASIQDTIEEVESAIDRYKFGRWQFEVGV
jgi:hypothetical protein